MLISILFIQSLTFCPDQFSQQKCYWLNRQENSLCTIIPFSADNLTASCHHPLQHQASRGRGSRLHLPPKQPFNFPLLSRGQITSSFWIQSPGGLRPQFELLFCIWSTKMLLLSKPSNVTFVFLFLFNLSSSWYWNRVDLGPVSLSFLINNSKIQTSLKPESLFFKFVTTHLKYAKICPELIWGYWCHRLLPLIWISIWFFKKH